MPDLSVLNLGDGTNRDLRDRKAVSTEASQGLSDTQKSNARENIGLGTASTRSVPSSGNANATQVVLGSDTRLTNARNAADVYDWAKAQTKPTYIASEVGLGNVGNFKAVSTVASQGLSDTEKANARTNIGVEANFVGTLSEWNSLSTTNKGKYKTVDIIET